MLTQPFRKIPLSQLPFDLVQEAYPSPTVIKVQHKEEPITLELQRHDYDGKRG